MQRTIPVPAILLERLLESYDDLASLAGTVNCYCDDQGKDVTDESHRCDDAAADRLKEILNSGELDFVHPVLSGREAKRLSAWINDQRTMGWSLADARALNPLFRQLPHDHLRYKP